MNLIDLTWFLMSGIVGLLTGTWLAHELGVLGWIIGVPAGFLLNFACVRWLLTFSAMIEDTYRHTWRPSWSLAVVVGQLAIGCAAGYFGARLLIGNLGFPGLLIGAYGGFLCGQLAFLAIIEMAKAVHRRHRMASGASPSTRSSRCAHAPRTKRPDDGNTCSGGDGSA